VTYLAFAFLPSAVYLVVWAVVALRSSRRAR